MAAMATIPAQFSEAKVLTFTNTLGADMPCIDMVEVNGKEALFTETFLGAEGSDYEGLVGCCLSCIFAVINCSR